MAVLDVFGPAPWVSPARPAVNRLPARATAWGYPDADAAVADRDRLVVPLDGRWAFRLLDRPGALTEADLTGGPIDGEIEVPGCWTRQGWDRPHYTNVVMPFRHDPPAVPDDNPTGVHRRRFALTAEQARDRVVLSVGGAESALFAFCNGRPVGMGKDSRLPHEFDLGPFVRPGENDLALIVVRWSDGSWLEDQDHWFHAGLHRSVELRLGGHDRIDDLRVDAHLDLAGGTGRAVVRAAVGLAEPEPGWVVRATLHDADGRIVAEPAAAPVDVFDRSSLGAEVVSAYTHAGQRAKVTIDAGSVEAWSHERPARYRLVAELVGPGGRTADVTATWIGFRDVAVRDGRLLLNGEPVLIAGVNRHDHDPVSGKAVSAEEMRRDLETMRAANVNAVRTAHYPNDPAFLDLCDELGLWVIDEANIETHGRMVSLLGDPRWTAAVMDRITRMVVRDRNHPSVFAWSLGNESGCHPVHHAAAAWVRATDPTRIVHYEGAVSGRLDDPATAAVTDIVCPMYPEIADIAGWARTRRARGEQRPLIMCEYSHAMGNSNGGLADYWEAIEAGDGLQGGFVWDWRDQGLLETTEDGRPHYAYGGFYGDEPNDGTFCLNGLCWPDGTPKPALAEHRWIHRPIRSTWAQTGEQILRLEHRRHWIDSGDLVGQWAQTIDGADARSGPIDVVLGPGEIALWHLGGDPAPVPRGAESHLVVRWRRRADGALVAWDQHPWPGATVLPLGVVMRPAPAIAPLPAVVAGPDPWLWRAPTDNDGRRRDVTLDGAAPYTQWLDWGLDRLETVADRTRSDDEGDVRIIELEGPGGLVIEHRQRVHGLGPLRVHDEEIVIPIQLDDLPRIGVRFELDGAFDRLERFADGPHENYVDRAAAAIAVRERGPVADQYVPYVLPQEHGNRTGARWMALRDEQGHGVLIGGGVHLQMAARFHHDVDLAAAASVVDLVRRDTIEVHVDVASRGMGTGACGPDCLPAHRVTGGRYRWRWWITPLDPGDDAFAVACAARASMVQD